MMRVMLGRLFLAFLEDTSRYQYVVIRSDTWLLVIVLLQQKSIEIILILPFVVLSCSYWDISFPIYVNYCCNLGGL